MKPERDAQAREALHRVRADAQSTGLWSVSGLARRLGAHFGGSDGAEDDRAAEIDPIEIWGRRIGRILSVVLASLLIWWLGLQLGWV